MLKKAAFRETIGIVLRFLISLGFICLFPFLCLIDIFWKIRIGELLDERIGHLVLNTAIFVRRQEIKKGSDSTAHVFVASNPANSQLLKMWKRRLNIIDSRWFARVYAGVAPVVKKTRFYQPLRYDGVEHQELSITEPLLEFTEYEEELGREGLMRMGIGDKDWFVCIHARDPAYISKTADVAMSEDKSEVRNCSINNYLDAANWISAQGGYVLRMGALVDVPFYSDDPRIIDYATHFRDQFMDIYLSSKCRFFLGCSSGLLYVPMLFGVPMGATNFVPFCDAGHGQLTTYIPKLVRRRGASDFMKFDEVKDLGMYEIRPGVNMGWNKKSYYDERGLELIENEADDILDLCKDMMDLVRGVAPRNEAEKLQLAYSKFYDGTLNESPYIGKLGPRFSEKYHSLISN